MPSIRSDDAVIDYAVLGRGAPVVLLHPFPAHRGVWLPVAEQLATRFRCIVPDLRGHGRSEAGNGPASMEKHAADVARICDAEGVTRAMFAGISIGGYVLFEFWRRYRERVAALVLADTRAQADNDETRKARLKAVEEVRQSGPAAFVDAQVTRLLGKSTQRNRPDVAESARAMMNESSVAGIVAVQQGMAARSDSVPTLKTIQVPTLIIVGDEDVVTPRADAELMHKAIPNSRLEVIGDAGHFSVFEQPLKAGRVLRQFLESL